MKRSEKHRHEPDLFAGFERPALSPDLKQQMLQRARYAARSQPSLTDRLWENHRLRLAWATTMVVLCLAHLYLAGPLMSPYFEPTRTRPADSVTAAESDLAPFLARHRTRDSSDSLRLRAFPMLLVPIVDLDDVS